MGNIIPMTITMDSDLKEDFRKFCKKKGYTMSARISILIFNEMFMQKEDDKNERTTKVY
ncbi:MAG: hypothetical protein Unbinned1693contig1002_25 [Prokaryotic dsDNA virus sp.]|jgi:hypothetical protein|nr:MAG: hypothetical protein Unbinned1693contig1002_25 [Prokaryotic dsDNA virus sp.]|tara:strand:+ start:2541 stop:2717 length:177 start_codon:yes stop_codon:yes gene_type:complete